MTNYLNDKIHIHSNHKLLTKTTRLPKHKRLESKNHILNLPSIKINELTSRNIYIPSLQGIRINSSLITEKPKSTMK